MHDIVEKNILYCGIMFLLKEQTTKEGIMKSNNIRVNVTHNDIYFHTDFGDFSSNPNLPFCEFRTSIEEQMYDKAKQYYRKLCNPDKRAFSFVKQLSVIFGGILDDAIASGTWMNEEQLYETETWRVVNMANAIRNR